MVVEKNVWETERFFDNHYIGKLCYPIRQILSRMRGIRLHPGDGMISALLARVDRRKQPVIGSLGRDHPLNRAMGRARYTFRRPTAPDWDLRSSFRAGRGLG